MAYIESGGRKKGCVPRANQCEAVVDVRRLPNPSRAVRAGEVGETFEELTTWISHKNPTLWEATLAKCRAYLQRGCSLRVECQGGQHRSYAIVQTLVLEYQSKGHHIEVVHHDKKHA